MSLRTKLVFLSLNAHVRHPDRGAIKQFEHFQCKPAHVCGTFGRFTCGEVLLVSVVATPHTNIVTSVGVKHEMQVASCNAVPLVCSQIGFDMDLPIKQRLMVHSNSFVVYSMLVSTAVGASSHKISCASICLELLLYGTCC